MSKLLIGCDPEVFVSKGGKLISAYGLIEGDKENPVKVNRGAVQVDGMALEFNTDPASNEHEFITNVNTVMGILEKMVPGCKLEIQAVAEFGFDYIEAQPKKAKELGCNPDYDAWKVAVNPRPNGDLPFRSAAGHLHLGFEDGAPIDDYDYIEYCAAKVRELDFYLALPSLFYDADTKRRELYGKAGAFRPKSYGFEYRTLSNAWLKTDELKRWAFTATTTAWDKIEAGVSLVAKYGDIQSIINNSDRAAAMDIIRAENILMPKGFSYV